MASVAYCLFDTAIGPCAIAWSDDGVVSSALPEADAVAQRARMSKRYPDAIEGEPPRKIASAIDGIRAMFAGAKCDLSGIDLDMRGVPPFNRRVFEIARAIPHGATLTYGDIALRLGDPSLSRAVGRALGENPFPPIVPCHRIVSADGKMHGFSAAGGVALKLRMLQLEGWEREQLSFFETP
jgi:methylated-DNA-[protein]-cysteine S-methyltransferase